MNKRKLQGKEGYAMKPQKLVHLEIIRFLAVCLVVFNHTDGYFLYFTTTEHPVTYLVSLCFSVVCRINVPLFFMVSGALLLKKQESLRELYRRRVSRIVIVLVLFSALQYADLVLRGQTGGEHIVRDFLKGLCAGDIVESYWFLYTYLAMLLGLPFLRRLAAGMSRTEFRYLFALKAVFDVLLKAFTLGSTVAVEVYIPYLTDAVFYPLAGYYIEWVMVRHTDHSPQAAGRYGNTLRAAAAGVLLLVLSMLAVYTGYCITGAYSQDWLGIFTPILAIIVYYVVKSLCEESRMPRWLCRCAVYLGSTAFGIYLTELPVRRLLLPVYLYLCEHTVGLVACPVYVLGTVGLAVIVVSILKQIPGLKKLL